MDNLALCQSMLDAYRPGHVDSLIELLDPAIVWATTEGWVEREVWRGRDEVRAALESFFDEWEEFSNDEILTFHDGGDCFAVATTMRGRHRHTGIETKKETAGVIDVQDGRIIRVVGYDSGKAAIEAVKDRRDFPRGAPSIPEGLRTAR
jgi:ketosteroid isomerase-like protein